VDASGGLIPDPGSFPAPKKSAVGGSFTYLVSLFGGQNGAAPTLSISATQWGTNMYNNFVNLHNSLGFDGIDIDLENAWGGTGDQVVCGLRTFFQLLHNGGYIVSMAPQTTAITPEVSVYQTGSWNSYVPLADTSILQYVDIVAVQLYNNAVPGNTPDAYAKTLEAGFSVSGCPCSASCKVQLSAKKIAFGYPAGQGAAPSGCPGQPGGCPYGSALTNVYQSSPTLLGTGGVMTWAVEWDEYWQWQFINAAKNIKFSYLSNETYTNETSVF
jgi:chitinase